MRLTPPTATYSVVIGGSVSPNNYRVSNSVQHGRFYGPVDISANHPYYISRSEHAGKPNTRPENEYLPTELRPFQPKPYHRLAGKGKTVHDQQELTYNLHS